MTPSPSAPSGVAKIVVTANGDQFIHLASFHPEFPEAVLCPAQQMQLYGLSRLMAYLAALLCEKGKQFPPGEYVLRQTPCGKPYLDLPFDPKKEGLA